MSAQSADPASTDCTPDNAPHAERDTPGSPHLIGVTMTIRRARRRRHHDTRYVYRIEQGITVVSARGEIDAHNAHRLLHEAKCRNIIDRPALVLDLTGLTFLSTHGLVTLIATGQRFHHAGLPWITVPSPAVSRLLEIGGTAGEVPTAETLDAALKVLTRIRQA